MKKILFIGNSHLIALIDAAKRHDAANHAVASDVRQESDFAWRSTAFRRYDFNLTPPIDESRARLRFILLGGAAPALFQVNASGQLALAKAFVDELDDGAARLGGRPEQVVSYLNGNEHSIFAMVEHPVPFDFHLDASDLPCMAGDAPRQVIPLSVMRRELVARAKPTILYCQVLKKMFPASDVVHVMPPPPIADEAQLRSNPEIFAQHFARFGLALPALRLKVYMLYVQVLTEALADVGVRALTAPDEAQADGFLREPFWMEATHANHRFGELVLHELGAL